MMTPFIPAAGRGSQAAMFYSGMYSGANVYYPPSAYGMPAMQPSAAAASKQQVMDSVRKQIEYYFSVENLCKDIFLRSKVCAALLAMMFHVPVRRPFHTWVCPCPSAYLVCARTTPDGSLCCCRACVRRWTRTAGSRWLWWPTSTACAC